MCAIREVSSVFWRGACDRGDVHVRLSPVDCQFDVRSFAPAVLVMLLLGKSRRRIIGSTLSQLVIQVLNVARLIINAWFVTRVLLTIREFRHAPCAPVFRANPVLDGTLDLVLRDRRLSLMRVIIRRVPPAAKVNPCFGALLYPCCYSCLLFLWCS